MKKEYLVITRKRKLEDKYAVKALAIRDSRGTLRIMYSVFENPPLIGVYGKEIDKKDAIVTPERYQDWKATHTIKRVSRKEWKLEEFNLHL